MSLQITRLLALQVAITMAIAAGTFALGNSVNGIAALLGGAAASMTALAYGAAYWIQSTSRSEKPLRIFLVAEICRVVCGIALVAIGMVHLPAEAAIFYLGAFAAALIAYLLVLLF